MFPNKLFYFNIRISCPRMCLLSGKIRLGFALDVNSERLWMCLYRWMPKNSLLKVYLIFFPSDQTMRLMLSRFFFQNNLGYSQKQDWEEFWMLFSFDLPQYFAVMITNSKRELIVTDSLPSQFIFYVVLMCREVVTNWLKFWHASRISSFVDPYLHYY